jgi:ubiquinone biosynthesis protein COQ4
MMPRGAIRSTVDLPRAARALSALIKNPDDLPQVFNLIDSMATPGHFRRSRSRFEKTDTGRRLLWAKPDIVTILADRERLRAMPDGSLGRAYLEFVETEKISPEGIRKASETERRLEWANEDIAFIRKRMRDTHDLWHAATGYRGDVLGEIGLLAFTVAQQWNTAIAVMVLAAILKARRTNIVGVVRDGYRRGRNAAWLPSQDWESLLDQPLDDVRARLKLGAPPVYTPIRTDELRAQGFLR